MAVGSILSNALSALQTNQAALNTTSANIANVNTPGYKRRVIEQEALQFGSTSAGVGIAEIRRIAATFLAREALKVTSDAARYATEAKVHDSLQGLFGRPDQNSSFTGRLDRVFATVADLSIDPTSVIRRSTLLGDLDGLAGTVSALAGQIQAIRFDVDQQVTATVTAINEALRQIDGLNPLVQRELISGGDAAGLRDQRDQAVRRLAEFMDVRVTEQESGKLYVSTPDGVPLVTEHLHQLDYTPPGPVSSVTIFDPVMVRRVDPTTGALSAQGTNLEEHLNSGTLRGLIDMRSSVLPDIARQVGEFARQVADALNAEHNNSTAVPPRQILTGRNTGLIAGDAHGFTGKTTVSVVAGSGALVSRVDVDFDTNTYSVDGGGPVAFGGTTLGDLVAAINAGLGANGSASLTNGVLTVQASGAGNGIAITQDATTPSARAGRGFAHFFGLNDIFEATAPLHYETGLSASDAHGFSSGQTFHLLLRGPNGQTAIDYTHTIAAGTVGDLVNALNASGTGLGGFVTFALDANGRMTATPTSAFPGYRIEIVDDNTTRGTTGLTVTELFGLGDNAQMDHAAGFSLRADLKGNPDRLAVSRLDLTASSAPGDLVLGAGDNRGALALSAVQSNARAIAPAGSLGALNTTLGTYAGTLLANAGHLAQRSDQSRDENETLKTSINERIEAVQGVNLDEELANMMLYQQSYNAAARLITASNEIFEALISAV